MANLSKDLYTIGSIMIHMVQKKDNMELEIILILLKGENHLRGIAKQLEESHSTISRKLRKLPEENAVDYKVEGKNKVFFIKKNFQAKNYVFSAERYKLSKLLKEYPRLSMIIDNILKKCSERMIILFGSYANFNAMKDSDIDIFIETKDRMVKREIELINSKISVNIGSFDQKSPLVKEIIKNHVILRGEEEFYDKIKFFE